mgnify:CR=1 FL=1
MDVSRNQSKGEGDVPSGRLPQYVGVRGKIHSILRRLPHGGKQDKLFAQHVSLMSEKYYP